MNKNEIIENLYNCPNINQAIDKMDPAELRGDLKQEMFMTLLELEPSRLFDMYEKGYLKFFLVRTMLNMIKSDRSTFFRNYRNLIEIPANHSEIVLEETSEHKEIDLVKVFGVTNQGLYERDMFILYADTFKKNAKELSRSTRIPYQTVIRTLKIAREKLKKYIKCSYQY